MLCYSRPGKLIQPTLPQTRLGLQTMYFYSYWHWFLKLISTPLRIRTHFQSQKIKHLKPESGIICHKYFFNKVLFGLKALLTCNILCAYMTALKENVHILIFYVHLLKTVLSPWAILETLFLDKRNTDCGFGKTGISTPVLPFNSYVALRKLFHLSDPQIPQLQMGTKVISCQTTS